jgi:hypothetical protein
MGASPWICFVPFHLDLDAALDALREREFEAGRYYPAMLMVPDVIDADTPGPGRQHATIADAAAAAGAEGTKSILDIESVADDPGFGIVCPLTDEQLDIYFETTTPTRRQILADPAMLNHVERGEAVCFPTYDEQGNPVALCFAGYSCD